MATNDIYRITAQFQSSSADIFQWVWHLKQAAGADVAPLTVIAAVATQLLVAWQAIDGSIHTSISGDTIEIAEWDSVLNEFNTIGTAGLAASFVGLNAADPLPFQDAGVVTLFTAVGRSLGKKFMFGFTETQQVGQSWTAGVAVDMALFAIAFIAQISAGGENFDPGNFNVATELFRPYTGTVAANLLIGTQDRRRRGIGI